MVFIIATKIQITHPLTGHSWLDLGLKILYTEQKFTNLPSFLSFAYLLFIYATEKRCPSLFLMEEKVSAVKPGDYWCLGFPPS